MNNPSSLFPMKYVDGILMVDHNGKILYSVRFNPRFYQESSPSNFSKIIGKNLLEVYTNITMETSTIYECLRTGTVVYSENQPVINYLGEFMNIHNVTIPIIKAGKVLGAIELSQDATKIQESAPQKNIPQGTDLFSTFFRKKKELYDFSDIITEDPAVLQLVERAKIIAAIPSPVLIHGETGTGKELFVQAIHKNSPFREGPFIDQNCASFPETLIEAALFGSVKGAFTGALDRIGLFEAADKGTLFLDEINSMPYHLQSRLLRVLQDGQIKRIGDTKSIHTQARIITAMNVDPLECVKQKILRDDLFYRLNVNSLEIPPLRHRRGDIPLLANYFIHRYNSNFGTQVQGMDPEVLSLFLAYPWPGNVRELQHVIESAMNMLPQNLICPEHLPIYLSLDRNPVSKYTSSGFPFLPADPSAGLTSILEEMERELILKAWKEQKHNISRTAAALKIPRQTLQYKLKKYGM